MPSLTPRKRPMVPEVFAHLAAKFGVKDSRGILLIPEFTHSDLAEMIGCSRPMVSRFIAEMISSRTLPLHGKQYSILDDSISSH
jgi:CRP-like cAMP-binding protein